MDTNDKGEYALLKVKQLALERNICLSAPTMPNCRYDLIVDCGERLVRAQVKYADAKLSQSTGSVYLDLRKVTRGNKRGKLFYTAKEVDVLLVYLPKIDWILWLEAEHFHCKMAITIRYQPTKNNQVKGCLMAEDHFW
jgi:hypothetical protein